MNHWPRLRPYALREWPGLTVLCGLSLVGVALEALLPWPLKLIIDNVISQEPLPQAAAWLPLLPGAHDRLGLLAWLSFGVFFTFLAARGIGFIKAMLEAGVTGRMKFRLGGDIFARLQTLSLTYHRRAHTGDLLHRVIDDTACLPTLVSGAVLPALTALVSLAVFFVIMWQLDAMLALMALVVAVPMGLLIRMLAPRMTQRAYEQQEREGEVWSVAEQSLSSLPVVQAFGRERHEGLRFQSVAGRTMQAYLRTIVAQLQFKSGVDASQAIGVALIMFVGGLHVQSGSLSVGSLVVFLSYLASLYGPLNTLAYLSSIIASAVASARRVLQVLDSDEAVVEARNAKPLAPPEAGRGGRIEFNGVVFGYDRGKPVLKGIDATVEAGETIALVGSTGAGKTTLVSLIPRLFDPWQGKVLLDGQNVRDLRISDVRSHVALVLQDPCLLPITIAENIAYGRPDASRADVAAAAVAARADDFIRKLPMGYDTVIGERGATLSGGEKQRLSIARALLKNAPILILDEPTSALDAETEDFLLQALERVMKGRTTLIIAHRLSTIRAADRVLLLNDGHVTQVSTREALRAQASLYGQSSVPPTFPSAGGR